MINATWYELEMKLLRSWTEKSVNDKLLSSSLESQYTQRLPKPAITFCISID